MGRGVVTHLKRGSPLLQGLLCAFSWTSLREHISSVFTNRILGRLSEAWPCYRVARGIAPSRYIYPTVKYKQWLEDDMKWILRDEKACMKTSKKERKAG